MKRIIVLSLAIMLCLTLAACGNGPETEQASPEIHTEAAGLEESKATNEESADQASNGQ